MNARCHLLVSLGRRIKQKRRAQKLSQKAFAEKSGLHRTYVSEVEHGRRNLTVFSLASIAAALRIYDRNRKVEREKTSNRQVDIKRLYCARKGEFADHHKIIQLVGLDLLACCQHS